MLVPHPNLSSMGYGYLYSMQSPARREWPSALITLPGPYGVYTPLQESPTALLRDTFERLSIPLDECLYLCKEHIDWV